MAEVRVLKELASYPEIEQLKADFSNYKDWGELPAYFGRDVPYHWPSGSEAANLYHLHLADSQYWPEWKDQYNRTSDRHLVYCQSHRDEDSYAFLAVFEPNAHSEAESLDRMNWLIDTAENFHKHY